MKRSIQNIILSVLAVTVFFTGAGVTIINYCCSGCTEQTLFMTQAHSCCSAEMQHEKQSCCSSEKLPGNSDMEDCAVAGDTHCEASRLSVDIDASMFRPQVVVPFVWITDASLMLSSAFYPDSSNFSELYKQSVFPPKILPRDYLSLISVLII